MIAKYAGPCAICPIQLRPGDHIANLGKEGSGRWVHANCQPDLAAVTAALQEPAAKTVRPGRATGHSPSKQRRAQMPTPPGAVEVYTDGACSGNPGPGGWAWAVSDGRQASGADPSTTNQRMEIRAALEAVQVLGGPLLVVSDSTYVVNCFRDSWWHGWRKNGWINSAKRPVVNRDLWEPLVDLVAARDDIAFRWIKGHSGDPMNELADQLAVSAGLRR